MTNKAPVISAFDAPALASATKHREEIWSGSEFAMIIFDSAKELLQLENMKLALLGKSRVGGYEATDDIAVVL